MSTIRATSLIGAKPSGVDDSNIYKLDIMIWLIIEYNNKYNLMSQRNIGAYKKYKTINNEPNSISQWDSYSRSRHGQNSFRKKLNDEDDGNWIGSESTPRRN